MGHCAAIMQINTQDQNRITAVLGPTNTGKTYLALERMTAHNSGMIGFPLRLLARENYDRVVRMKGIHNVALITGEERIIPPHARYFLCTVESMPLERSVDFLAIDEIQLCADPDRGYIFTDRLLNARGRSETMFMGSASMTGLIRRLVPDVDFEDRPRFSKLTYTGSKKITRLPPRSAIVAFSAAEVYAIAELIRRQKGGAAVVMGALSPRTRNAQVDLYQQGEVDYIVATDAIGMGLNMDVDHVAFAALSKFDGHAMRALTTAETAQIAGRAGRYMRDGTFGVTADCRELEGETVERLESHEFSPIDQLYWRNSRLRFTSLDVLQMDLRARPQTQGLMRPRSPEDERTLDFLAKQTDVVSAVRSAAHVRLLWDVCQTPDFAQTMSDSHPRFLGQLFLHLQNNKGQLPTDWIAGHVQRLDRTDGDIDTLTQRLAHIRTWTYLSQRATWFSDADFWQGHTRSIEDRISDALHEQLTKRFVDRRTSTLMKRLKDREDLIAAVNAKGEVLVEGHYVGHLEGFTFKADLTDNAHAKRAVNSAALKALRQEMNTRVTWLCEDRDDAFRLDDQGLLLWRDTAIARLQKGHDILSPTLKMLPFDQLDESHRQQVIPRLNAWLKAYIEKTLRPLFQGSEAQEGAMRGLIFQLREGLGSVERRQVASLVTDLSPQSRKALRRQGIIIGRHYIYAAKLLKKEAIRLRALLWTIFNDPDIALPPLDGGLVSFPTREGIPQSYYAMLGYRRFSARCIRLDALERLAETAWQATTKGPAPLNGTVASLVGCRLGDLKDVLSFLGYRITEDSEGQQQFERYKKHKKPHPKAKQQAKKKRVTAKKDIVDSPFASLKILLK